MEDIFEELAAAGSDEEGREEEHEHEGGGTRDDEAEEANDTRRVVKPKRVISRPQPKLNPARLLGPRGIFTIQSTFDNIKLRGKGHELDDLNNVLSRLQHWAHRLFPKMTFEDCIERIENLGNKREIMTNMHKIRNGMIDQDSGLPSQDDAVDRIATPPPEDNPFDQLIAMQPAAPPTLTDEQRARMMRNRLIAEERRMARRLAREKELEEQRRVANGDVDESANVAINSSPAPSTNNALQSPETVLPHNNPTTNLKENLACSVVDNHTSTFDQSTIDDAGEMETRILGSPSSKSSPEHRDPDVVNLSQTDKTAATLSDSAPVATDPMDESSAEMPFVEEQHALASQPNES